MRWVSALAILLMIAIAVAPATAQTFDNNGGGTWSEYISFPITTIPAEYAQYQIVVNGSSWEIYNATGSLEVSGVNNNFWSLVNSSGADIRVFNQNYEQLYFYIESFDYVNQKAVIWVNVTANTMELNIAYGNPDALPSVYNNGSMVFEWFFDDFEDGDVSDWLQLEISGTGSFGVTTDATQGSYAGVGTITSNPYGAYKRLSTNLANDLVLELWVKFQYDSEDFFLVDDTDQGANWGVGQLFYVGTTPLYPNYLCYYDSAWHTVAPINYNQWYKIKIVVHWATGYDIYLNDQLVKAGAAFRSKGSYVSRFAFNMGAYFTSGTADKIFLDAMKIYKLADPADFGTPIIKQFAKQLAQRTLYVDVTYLDTQTTVSHNPPAYFKFEPKDTLNVSATLDITGVNATVGANIVIKLIDKVTLTTVIYNGTDITASLTYQGTETNATTGDVYNLYNFTTYENGTLEVYGTIPNIAVNTVFKFDGDVVDVSTVQAVIGEDFDIKLPWTGNITVASKEFTNVSNATVNTKDLGTGAFNVLIVIEDIDNYKLGYLTKTLNVTYGSLSVTVRHKDLSPFTNAVVSSYNEKFGIITTDLNKLYAGNNVISVFFHGIKLKSVTFYLNHTTTGASITIDVNSTRFTDYRGVNRTIASPNSFDIVNLSADYPYSVIQICNYSGTVIIDYEANPPTAVNVEGADFVEYIAPILKFSGSGNATVTDLYKLTVTIKDRLGNPVNFYVTINGSKVGASKGIATKLLKPSWYEVVAPTDVNGFKLWSFSGGSNNVVLVEVNTTDVSLAAEYRVPSTIETKEVRIESLFGWLPIPFLSPKQDENITIVRLEGSLKDFYGAPIANKTIKIEVASPKFTRIYNVTTDSSGNFKLEVDMAKGVEYKVTYTYEGDDVYVGTSTSKTFYVESLLPAPPAPTEPLLIVVIVAAIGAGVVAVIYLAKKRTAVARTRIEQEFKFFKRLK